MNDTQYISDFLAPRDAWDKLSIEEQAAMMKTAVSEGILDLDTIRQKYNEFAEGGNTDDDLVDWIIREEGFIANPRDIGDGKMTLGSGLTAQKWHDQYKRNGNKWTSSDNRRAVREEVANRRRWAEKNIPNWDSLPSSSQKALLSYKYNYDFNQANSPKLFKALSDSNLQEAARQMDATSSNPIFKKGLQDRRQREQEWFLRDVASPQVSDITYQPAVSTQIYNPYVQQAEATRVLPIDEPDPNSYIRTREVSPQEQRRRRFQENLEAYQRFNTLMDMIDIKKNPTPSYVPNHPLFELVNGFAEGGSKEEEEEANTIVPFTQRREVIITPDSEYNQYLNTLPDNQRFTPNDKYDSYFYWKLNGKPRNFEEAYNKGMFHYDHSDNGYHANSIAFDDNTGVGYFMKPKTHDTVGYELDWFNKGLVTEEGGKQRPVTPEEAKELEEFRKNYFLTNDPDRPNYYRYQPIEKAEGGSIHIKPSHRGRLTELKNRTGKTEAELYNDGNPAHKKMVVFARNSRKWKHGLGGNLFDGTTKDNQQMQIGLKATNSWKPFTLDDILANAARIEQQKQAMEDRLNNVFTLSNDATSVANGRPQNRHLERRAIEGAKAHRAWEKEHPTATQWSDVLGAVPFVVASYPFVTGAVVPGVTALGDAAAATTAGKALTSALTPIATATTTKLAGAPALGWADAGLQSLMAVHGLNTAVEEGGVSPTTALELSPLVPPTIGIGNNLYLPHLREHIYASKAPIGYDGVRKAAERIAEGVLSGRRADIENPFWFNPKSAEALQDYAFVPNSVQGAEREQYLKEFGEKALRARADIWRMYNRLPQKYNTFVESEKFPEAYTAPDDIKALHWVPQPRENIDPGDFVNSVGGNVGLPEITNLGRGIPEPGYSSKEFGVTTLTDLWDLHPFSRPGDRLISRLKSQWNSSTYKAANAIRKVVGSNYIKDGSGTYIPVPNSHTYITKLEDVDLLDTGASIGQVQSTSPILVSKAPSKIAQRTANKILKLADKVENIEAPNFTILKPIDNKLAKFEIGRLFGGKPVLVKNEIPWTMDRKFIDTDGNIGFQSSWTQGFNSTNILPQSVIDWKRGYLPALLEEPNINPDIFKYLTR